MEIYKDLSNPASQEFEKLLNSQLSKTQVEEGKIIEGKVNKITEKYVFIYIENLKSEPVLDINELKSMGLEDKIKLGETIPVLLEHIENKSGEVVVSASKAQKIKGWTQLVEAYEKEESPAAKDAMAQILINSRLCAEGKRPICQDTGIVTVFFKIGMNVTWEGDMSVADMVNEGVRRAYLLPGNVLRASILEDPAGAR